MNERFDPRRERPRIFQRDGVTVTRVGANLGAEISGVDLRQPLSDRAFQAIGDALVENELIIFRNQEITSDNLMDFGRRFGDLTVHPFSPNEETAPELIKFRNDETNPPLRRPMSGTRTRPFAPSRRWRRFCAPRRYRPSAATPCS